MRKFRDTLPKEVTGLQETKDPTREKRILYTNQPWMFQAKLPVMALVVLVALLFAGCGNRGTGGGHQASQSSVQNSTQSAKKGQASEAEVKLVHPALGEKNAPVVMVEYGDYQ